MKIAITGANGFIGKLVMERHLSIGDSVHILTRKAVSKPNPHPNLLYHTGDLLDLEQLKLFLTDVDVLYHCAAEILDESKMQAVNVVGTKNLIAAAAGNVRHWVQLSSVGVYGQIFSGTVTEEQPYNPVNEYERTKLQSDILVINAAAGSNFTYTIIRPSNVFGPTMRNQSLFKLIKTIQQGKFFFIGKRGASANYVPVENVVEALFLAATDPKAVNEIYNISEWCTIEEFVETIASAVGKKSPSLRISKRIIMLIAQITAFIPSNPLTPSRVKALTSNAIYSSNKIKAQLNYRPVSDLKSAIADLTKNCIHN